MLAVLMNHRAAITLAVAALLPPATRAASVTWTNSANDALWSNPLNWSSNLVPATGDDLTFPNVAPNGATTITLPDGASASRIDFLRPYTLTGGTLSINLTQAFTGAGNTSIL